MFFIQVLYIIECLQSFPKYLMFKNTNYIKNNRYLYCRYNDIASSNMIWRMKIDVVFSTIIFWYNVVFLMFGPCYLMHDITCTIATICEVAKDSLMLVKMDGDNLINCHMFLCIKIIWILELHSMQLNALSNFVVL